MSGDLEYSRVDSNVRDCSCVVDKLTKVTSRVVN